MVVISSRAVLAILVSAANAVSSPSATINFPSGTIVGKSATGIDSFIGIPFAQPPTGTLRLFSPLPITTTLGTVQATNVPLGCLQGNVGDPGMNEDCLTLNVQRPSTAQAGSGLPVAFWIYGGGFVEGSTAKYNANDLIQKSISLGGPIVYVTANYRLGAFGWLPGQEVLDAGISNLGHLDQRLALQWVADNIAQFGGEPANVTIWGESAGSASVFNQMALFKGNNTYKNKPLFRGAIMNSGSIVPTQPINTTKAQDLYDTVVNTSGCSSAPDTLACLRTVSNNTLLMASGAASASQNAAGLAGGFKPRPDGVVIAASPELLVNRSQYTRIPFIVGDEEDEGAGFAHQPFGFNTTSDLIDYFATDWFPLEPQGIVAQVVQSYPNNPAAGSPFRTGQLDNTPYPEYKRTAAIMGDLAFTLTRRVFLVNANIFNPDIPSWSYLGSQLYNTSDEGTKHASDVAGDYGHIPTFFSNSVQTYYISFFNALDPNALIQGQPGLKTWPVWSDGQQLLWFKNTSNALLADTFRNTSFTVIYDNIIHLRI